LDIVDFGNLPEELEPQVQLLDVGAGWAPMDARRVREAIGLGYPAAPYFGVYAIEKGEVVSAVKVLRVPFTKPHGKTETVSVIQGVVTRRDRSGKGLARLLLEEVHRREKEAGYRLALLWTGRANVAHGLYSSLGYVDVYSSDMAIKRIVQKRRPSGYEMKAVKEDDFGRIESIHALASKGRTGFVPRPKGLLNSLFKLGLLPPKSLSFVELDGEPVGYVQTQVGDGWAKAEEVILRGGVDRDAVVSMLESQAAPGWLTFLGTFARDSSDLLKGRGYMVGGLPYYGLMARRLSGGSSDLRMYLDTESLTFSCHYLDYFYC
jgi:GNAT superfamily N-acetyltransferase